MRLFYLYRRDDESGVSGLGFVAEGVVFPGGKCVLHWRTALQSIAVYDNTDTLEKIHGHNKKTIIVWDDMDKIGEDGIPYLFDGCAWYNGKTSYHEGSAPPYGSKKPSEYLKEPILYPPADT